MKLPLVWSSLTDLKCIHSDLTIESGSVAFLGSGSHFAWSLLGIEPRFIVTQSTIDSWWLSRDPSLGLVSRRVNYAEQPNQRTPLITPLQPTHYNHYYHIHHYQHHEDNSSYRRRRGRTNVDTNAQESKAPAMQWPITTCVTCISSRMTTVIYRLRE